ncbi:family 16 glycoside hydrolase [Euzebyella saccharophila]|uniref:Family 16 glycoside hydrolase n=1 Tax=Euzebyella saccharophila TaxID=679664 RepID=A0ABV8K193_9FLAO|nr:family 16 glycoside hydrolase [Euzebyella saccharophila]
MKNTLSALIFIFFLSACTESEKMTQKDTENSSEMVIPFTAINLIDFGSFQHNSNNWQIVGDVYVNRFEENSIHSEEGIGVLLNKPTNDSKNHLITNFEHGDLELEVDVMIPYKSNSGIYFQGRYEVQLFDSWGVDHPTYTDMGGIYQRWDDNRAGEDKGFDGHSPKENASKAPGLWQHLRVIFHAPKFDFSGNKIANATFEKVWLNDVLIHEDVELSGPTRSGLSNEEVEKGPLMIQGDHGPVAFRNLKYKSYDDYQLALSNLKVVEYDYKGVHIPNLDTIPVLRKLAVDSVSSSVITENRVFRLVEYNGDLIVPKTGEYLFQTKFHSAGGALLIDGDTIVMQDGSFEVNNPGRNIVELKKGKTPFQFIYNKNNQWTKGFEIGYEGPGIQLQKLSAPGSLVFHEVNDNDKVVLEAHSSVVAQRGFFMHNNIKRTHTIAVGSPVGTHFNYDLSSGTLLAAWSGTFYDVTDMWHNRGIEQLGRPMGFTLLFSGKPQFASLDSEKAVWPENDFAASPQNYDGYELNEQGYPIFLRTISGVQVLDKLEPLGTYRSLNRKITKKGDKAIWHRLAEGDAIKELPDGTFLVDGANYFIEIKTEGITPTLRNNEGTEEMLVKVPAGNSSLEYNIIW